jgi:copper homeostasis protein
MTDRPGVLIEACVTSVEEAVEAERLGADRLELCVDLEVGGLTPPPGLLASVVDAVSIPVFGMVRDRPGDFHYSKAEGDGMVESAARLVSEGAQGLVWGALDPDGMPDVPQSVRLIQAAQGLPLTFHRAFDEVPGASMIDAALTLGEAGVARILTSGGPGRALDHAPALNALATATGHHPTILVGGGVRGDHVADLVARTGCTEVHVRLAGVAGIVAAFSNPG